MVEVMYLSLDPRFTVRLLEVLEQQTGQDYGYDFNKWYEWIWDRPPRLLPQYADVKSCTRRFTMA